MNTRGSTVSVSGRRGLECDQGDLQKKGGPDRRRLQPQPCPGSSSLWSGRQWPSCAGEEPGAGRGRAGRPRARGCWRRAARKDRINSPNCTNRVSPRSGSGCQRSLPTLGPQENNLNSMKVLLAAVWRDWRALATLPGASTPRTEEPGPSGGGEKGLVSFQSSHAGLLGPPTTTARQLGPRNRFLQGQQGAAERGLRWGPGQFPGPGVPKSLGKVAGQWVRGCGWMTVAPATRSPLPASSGGPG